MAAEFTRGMRERPYTDVRALMVAAALGDVAAMGQLCAEHQEAAQLREQLVALDMVPGARPTRAPDGTWLH